MVFHVYLEQAEDGSIVAICPALPDCISEGQDAEEALENIKEVIKVRLAAKDQKAIDRLLQAEPSWL